MGSSLEQCHTLEGIKITAVLGIRIICREIVMMQVNFLTKLVALRPGKTVREMIKNVMQGKDEGADDSAGNEEIGNEGRISNGIAGKVRFSKYLIVGNKS